jgi:hypothetical protein
MSNEINDKIFSNHQKGSGGMFAILFKHGTFKKWPLIVSTISSFIPCLLILIFKGDISFSILSSTAELTMTVFPCLLGFSLAGYAIVVGYSNIDLIKASTTPQKHNPYQILSAIFGISLLMQVITTILGFLITMIVRVDIAKIFKIGFGTVGNIINAISLFALLLFSFYSLIL